MAKARRQDASAVTTTVEGTQPDTSAESIESAIARRAFELYCDRGCEDGYDVDDWLEAEREVRGDVSSAAA